MPWLGTLTVVGLVVLAALVILFIRARNQDQIEQLLAKRRGSARIVSRADYIEGLERIGVALALTSDTFHYENADLEARFDLNRIEEVEYDNELATGRNVTHGCSVLRLRSHGTTFEFILAQNDCERWKQALPPHRMNDQAAQAV